MKTIQMIVTQEGDAMFIFDFDKKSNKLTFRSSLNPAYKQTEQIAVKDDVVYTNVHYFPIAFLQKFLTGNKT